MEAWFNFDRPGDDKVKRLVIWGLAIFISEDSFPLGVGDLLDVF
jgi:hypothetical protein